MTTQNPLKTFSGQNVGFAIPAVNYTHVPTSTSKQVTTAPGFLGEIVVNNPGTSATISIHDCADEATIGTAVALVAGLTAPVTLQYWQHFLNGIYVVTAGAGLDITVGWL